jgi:hypothetical protein
VDTRVIVAVVGVVTLLLGVAGLLRPEWVMNFVGYAVASDAPATLVRGEIRAVYGGLMIAAGVLTLLAAPAPRVNQGKLVLLGLLWVGTGCGRLFGVFVDGNPGVIGWLAVVLELGGGAALLYASQFAADRTAPAPSSRVPSFTA